jgi:RNA polymerase sigma-70 factor (ECF subfamily)
VFGWLSFRGGDDETDDQQDDMQQAEGGAAMTPEARLQLSQATEQLISAVQKLPMRQQQAFMLRLWEGLSVAETATAMSVSEGSVKTHYSRAINTLRSRLEGCW